MGWLKRHETIGPYIAPAPTLTLAGKRERVVFSSVKEAHF